MSGLMDKAKDALKGNDKAQGFADKQVTSRTFNPPISILRSATKLTFVFRGRQVHRRPWHGRQVRQKDLRRHQQADQRPGLPPQIDWEYSGHEWDLNLLNHDDVMTIPN